MTPEEKMTSYRSLVLMAVLCLGFVMGIWATKPEDKPVVPDVDESMDIGRHDVRIKECERRLDVMDKRLDKHADSIRANDKEIAETLSSLMNHVLDERKKKP